MKFLIVTIIAIFSVLTFFMVNTKNGNAKIESVLLTKNNEKPFSNEATSIKNNDAAVNLTIINKWLMPEELMEISGLGFIDNDRVAAVQDELGIIYLYNLKTQKVEHRTTFQKQGDFEGVEVVGSTAWVIRSDGHLYEVLNFETDKPIVNEYNTTLTSKENIEGLALDKKNNRLLLSVKDRDNYDKNTKGIYAFNLQTKKMDNDPAYKIELKNDFFKGKKSHHPRPSAVAVDPGSENIFVLDGPSARLLILGTDSKLKSVIELDKKQFRQAEGIAFSPDGKMYISNEGTKKEPGNIYEVVLN